MTHAFRNYSETSMTKMSGLQ